MQTKLFSEKYGLPGDYVAGANIAGFLKVAEAMTAQENNLKYYYYLFLIIF